MKKKGQKGPDTSSKLSDVMLRSVLRTIRVIITSISSKIVQPSHVPSRTMLAEYFSLSKLLELLPRIVDRDVEDARDVIMNVTYFMELVGQLTAIHVSPVKSSASKKNSTSPTVTPYYMQLSLSCVSAAIKTMADRGNEMGLIQYSPLSHAVVSIVCLLKCEVLICSVFLSACANHHSFTVYFRIYCCLSSEQPLDLKIFLLRTLWNGFLGVPPAVQLYRSVHRRSFSCYLLSSTAWHRQRRHPFARGLQWKR